MKRSIRTKKWWTLIILVVFIVMTAGMEAMAKPKDKTAKQLISEGAKAYEKDDYDTALAKFEEAYNMEQTTSLLYNLGRVNESKGEFSTAMAYYRNYVTAPDADEDARTDALERIEQLEKIITIQNGGSLTGANINTNTNTKAAPKGAAKANKAAAPAGMPSSAISISLSVLMDKSCFICSECSIWAFNVSAIDLKLLFILAISSLNNTSSTRIAD